MPPGSVWTTSPSNLCRSRNECVFHASHGGAESCPETPGGAPVKKQKNVLVALGWYDHRLLQGIAAYATQNRWHLAAHSIIHEKVIPWGWEGDGVLAWLATGTTSRTSSRQSKSRRSISRSAGRTSLLRTSCRITRRRGNSSASIFSSEGCSISFSTVTRKTGRRSSGAKDL